MKCYRVSIPQVYTMDILVEAESPDEAITNAMEGKKMDSGEATFSYSMDTDEWVVEEVSP